MQTSRQRLFDESTETNLVLLF